MANLVKNGAEVKVFVDNELVGLYENVNWSSNIGTEAIYTLGRFGAHEINVTSHEPISVNCGGFRILDQGVHKLPKFPKLQDLLGLGRVTLTVTDRSSGKALFTVINAVANAYSGGFQAKATSRFQVTYTGTASFEEDGAQSEGDAVNLPQ
jgi:hypothetical protein